MSEEYIPCSNCGDILVDALDTCANCGHINWVEEFKNEKEEKMNKLEFEKSKLLKVIMSKDGGYKFACKIGAEEYDLTRDDAYDFLIEIEKFYDIGINKPLDILKIIKVKDEGYELCGIGIKYNLDGDMPCDFLQAVEDYYFKDEFENEKEEKMTETIEVNGTEIALRIYLDGDKWCCVNDNSFENLQESPAGFGDTQEEAIEEFRKALRGGDK